MWCQNHILIEIVQQKITYYYYVGSLRNRVYYKMKENIELFVFLADQLKALTDHARILRQLWVNWNVALDYLAAGLDPEKTTIFIQSQIPSCQSCQCIMNLVSLARLERNPTVKSEIVKGFGESIQLVFIYPIATADITAFGELCSSRKMIKTNDWTNSWNCTFFNYTYNCDVLVGGHLSSNEAAGRLPGLDGNAKMSKSLNNGIYLLMIWIYYKRKWWAYTDPDHIKIEDLVK